MTGALRRARGVSDPAALLRVLLLHLGCGYSLAETALRARQAGLGKLSSVAVFKRLQASGEWLRWLALGLRQDLPPVSSSAGRRVRAVDATTVSEPGSTGTDWRIHFAVDLHTLHCDFFELTDVRGGESWSRYPVQAGEILIGDRGYATGRGVRRVVKAGGDVIVRWRRKGLPLEDGGGAPLDPLAQGGRLKVGEVREVATRLQGQQADEKIPGRLFIVRRSAASVHRARKALLRTAARKKLPVSKGNWKAAEYFILWTTLGADYKSEQVLAWYRLRWQIELSFKRLKSILGVGHLPKKDPASARAWLHGKLMISLLVERLLEAANKLSPWGYELEPAAEPVAGDRVRHP
jgi:hypothetical protein